MTRAATAMILLFTASAFIGHLEGSRLTHPPTHPAVLPPWVKPTTGAILKVAARSSEDVTANLGALVTSVTVVANNENTTVSIVPAVPLAQALLSVLEEMEERFQLVTKATVTPLSSTEFEIAVSGYYDSEDRFICGGLCIGGAIAALGFSSGWFGY